jgi:hypothetical protein
MATNNERLNSLLDRANAQLEWVKAEQEEVMAECHQLLNEIFGSEGDQCADEWIECPDCGAEFTITDSPDGDETVKTCPYGCMKVTIRRAW